MYFTFLGQCLLLLLILYGIQAFALPFLILSRGPRNLGSGGSRAVQLERVWSLLSLVTQGSSGLGCSVQERGDPSDNFPVIGYPLRDFSWDLKVNMTTPAP